MLQNATIQQAQAGFRLNGEYYGIEYDLKQTTPKQAVLFPVSAVGMTLQIDLETVTLLDEIGTDVTPATTDECAELLSQFALKRGGGAGVQDVSVVNSPLYTTIKSEKLLFGDDLAVTKRISTFAEKWSQGLPLGGFKLTDGSSGYWRVLKDVNDANYHDGVSEVGLLGGALADEHLIANTEKSNRYLAGHASYFGFTSSWNADAANGDFEMLIGGLIRGAVSEGRDSEIKDAILFGLVRESGIDKWVCRVIKNFVAYPDYEFVPEFIPADLTIFELIFGYYGIHPILLDYVVNQNGKELDKQRAFARKFMQNLTHVSDPNLSLGVYIANKGNTGNIYMRNGSIEFGNYIEPRDNTDPTARDVSHTIEVASIAVDPDYTDGSGLLGAYTVPDVVNMVEKYEAGALTFADFTNTVSNRLFSIQGQATANKIVSLNIDLLPKDAVVLNGGATYTQLNPGRNVLSYALAANITSVDFTRRIDATITRTINSFSVIDLEGVGSDLNSAFVAVLSLSSNQSTTASDVSVSVITKDLF